MFNPDLKRLELKRNNLKIKKNNAYPQSFCSNFFILGFKKDFDSYLVPVFPELSFFLSQCSLEDGFILF